MIPSISGIFTAMILSLMAQTAVAGFCDKSEENETIRAAACLEDALAGDAHGQYWYGYYSKHGIGTAKNLQQTLKWYQKAARQGMPEAQLGLGMMFENGEGVRTDHKQAVSWYKIAAEQGNSDAQWVLGAMYEFGRGVIQDRIQAYTWYSIAAAGNNPYAMNRKVMLGSQMLPAQTREAEKRAGEWMSSQR